MPEDKVSHSEVAIARNEAGDELELREWTASVAEPQKTRSKVRLIAILLGLNVSCHSLQRQYQLSSFQMNCKLIASI